MRGVSELEGSTEEISTDWTKCVPLVGSLPRPDFTVGFQSSAFTRRRNQETQMSQCASEADVIYWGLVFSLSHLQGKGEAYNVQPCLIFANY